jgi:hypothetical protein
MEEKQVPQERKKNDEKRIRKQKQNKVSYVTSLSAMFIKQSFQKSLPYPGGGI